MKIFISSVVLWFIFLTFLGLYRSMQMKMVGDFITFIESIC